VQSGTLSTRERGEPGSFNAIRIQSQGDGMRRVEVDRFWWNERQLVFVKTVTEAFDFGAGGWTKA
jgi:hypothetical protein